MSNQNIVLRTIEWSEKFSVGHPVMDEHHKTLLEYINQLIEIVQSDIHEEQVRWLIHLPKFQIYADRHFTVEERLLSKVNFPNLDEQIQQHGNFSDRISRLIAQGGLAGAPCHFAESMMHWWTDHVLVHDMAYKQYMVQLQE